MGRVEKNGRFLGVRWIATELTDTGRELPYLRNRWKIVTGRNCQSLGSHARGGWSVHPHRRGTSSPVWTASWWEDGVNGEGNATDRQERLTVSRKRRTSRNRSEPMRLADLVGRQVSPLSEKKLLKKGTQRACTEREISNYLKDTSVNILILPLGLCLSGLPWRRWSAFNRRIVSYRNSISCPMLPGLFGSIRDFFETHLGSSTGSF